ncbi:hypothetical protein [Chelativorans sp. M5D2P16]|uniref:hypothetical protein n=1 Tax=Chelativorans sp. M5D2P16 TaxID=3095678 RepID=UPI002ACB0336|nr:hypothetical protein [Chelativorans sp. M5D2P16]MDZ5697828.1 hypothetical protein [Chelativorans sp. M5D2P16]
MLGLSIGTWLKAGAVLIVLAGVAWSHRAAYQAGRTAEQAAFAERINQENEDAGKAAEDWRARYRRCAERGGLYDFERGACHN